MADDDTEFYRVVVLRKAWAHNPDYLWHSEDPERRKRCIYSDTETVRSVYGPYTSLGVAKGQRTSHTIGAGGEALEGVVGSGIERARVIWEEQIEGLD
ncbi:hypothetical protein [Streptomyces sp. NPDC051561]|uniref:hypothetical protein n=1 Tax=Streptomyces sp. NPDC051561 TaxID=3365658 RepID=UPI0037A8695C